MASTQLAHPLSPPPLGKKMEIERLKMELGDFDLDLRS